jgi:exosome complex component RRP4
MKKRELVIPGDILAEGDYNSGKNTYREDKKIYASCVGLANHVGRNVYVVAIKGGYLPVVGDLVIGKVVDMRLSGWIIEINAPYPAMLFTSDALGRSFNSRRDELSAFLDIGDLVLAKIYSFDRTKDPTLTIKESGLGKISHGYVFRITPTKIPRMIGRKGSMVNMLKRETQCNIIISQNGYVMIYGRNPDLETLAIQAIQLIEKDAHTLGLTDRVSEFLKEGKEKSEKRGENNE